MTIEYADTIVGPYKLYYRPVPKFGPMQLSRGQNSSGYGKRISTDIALKFDGEKRERRVYCTCYSNVGSHWIVYKGKTLHLRTHLQDEIIQDN